MEFEDTTEDQINSFYGDLVRIAFLHELGNFKKELRSMMFVFFMDLQVRHKSMSLFIAYL